MGHLRCRRRLVVGRVRRPPAHGTDAARQPAESAPLRRFVAYFLIGVIIPVGALSPQGNLSGFNSTGLITATVAGALGAAGAACIIWAFKTPAACPVYVMPLVFGGAPLVMFWSRW